MEALKIRAPLRASAKSQQPRSGSATDASSGRFRNVMNTRRSCAATDPTVNSAACSAAQRVHARNRLVCEAPGDGAGSPGLLACYMLVLAPRRQMPLGQVGAHPAESVVLMLAAEGAGFSNGSSAQIRYRRGESPPT